jgi:hypothetical protein
MMISMSKKKGPTHISFRLKPAELEPLDADRKALPGVPVARNTYAKHAVQQYPRLRAENEKLRKLEEAVRKRSDSELGNSFADTFLREAGL